jgi:uncharacterized RDD family membrane protein YckC
MIAIPGIISIIEIKKIMEQILDTVLTETKPVVYIGFWMRTAAYLIDGIIIGIIQSVIMLLMIGSTFTNMGANAAADPGFMPRFVSMYSIVLVIQWLYFAGMESSSKQATLGKMALGIKVTDLNGERISFGKATGRYFSKIISAIILCIGYIMVAFTEKKQGLHDQIAGTLVVKNNMA